jgi:hypothetical protein
MINDPILPSIVYGLHAQGRLAYEGPLKTYDTALEDNVDITNVSGSGEKVDTIVQLLGVDASEKQTTIRALNQLALANENDLELAKTSIEVYDVQ